MKEKIKVHLYMEGSKKTELIEILADSSFRDFVKSDDCPCDFDEKEWCAMHDDSDDTINLDDKIAKHAVKNKIHIHVCRCKKVEVTVSYNGVEKTRKFPSSAKIRRILRWALKEFGISEEEAPEHILCLGEEELNERDSIGLYVSWPECSITLLLVRKEAVNGWM